MKGTSIDSFDPHYLGANWTAYCVEGHKDKPTRWLVYIDLLGFTQLVGGNITNAVITYLMSRKIVELWVEKSRGIHLACFSDSYVLYADDDTAKSFRSLEHAARCIINDHVQKKLPLVAAISCGQFYADSANNVFIGKGYLEANRFTEDQDWVGLVLCRSATKRLIALRLSPSRLLNYRRWKIPFKSRRKSKRTSDMKPLYAYVFGASPSVNGKNIYLEFLREMLTHIRERKVRRKYLNAIQFLEHFGVMLPAKSDS